MTDQTAVATSSSSTWVVEPTASEVRFEVTNMWGLAKVKGSFERVEGSLYLGDDDSTAALEIDADSVYTGNARRDTHLRSKDFFHSDEYPTISFQASSVTRTESGASIRGHLRVRETRIPLDLGVLLSETSDGVVARAETTISREAAGLTWNWLGMVRGDAVVRIELSLIPERVARFAGQD